MGGKAATLWLLFPMAGVLPDATWQPAWADSLDPTPPLQSPAAAPVRADAGEVAAYLDAWASRVAAARESQPEWASPLVTTTGLLEQRLRFDVALQHAGNGARTVMLDGGRGVDLIVAEDTEIQIAAAPYVIRTNGGIGQETLSGFADWPFLRLEHRLAGSPASEGNYVLTAWLQIQAPAGIQPLTNHAWVFQPTIAFGKGWGAFDVQGTAAASLPSDHVAVLGHPVITNIALQYRLFGMFWPEMEVNWTYFPDGLHGGLNQVYLTSGMVMNGIKLDNDVRLSFGVGYQKAVSPPYRERPLIPAYDHAWLFTARTNF
jgi:hypothetical protein